MKWRAAILKVLDDAGRPMHYLDITQEIVDKGYRTRSAQRLQQPSRRTSQKNLGLNASAQAYIESGVVVAGPSSDEDADLDAVANVEATEQMGLINAFGMFWRRSEVDWSARNPSC
jgi:hypothetical protein